MLTVFIAKKAMCTLSVQVRKWGRSLCADMYPLKFFLDRLEILQEVSFVPQLNDLTIKNWKSL